MDNAVGVDGNASVAEGASAERDGSASRADDASTGRDGSASLADDASAGRDGNASRADGGVPVVGEKAASAGGPCPSHCPIHDLISRLGDKWSVLVLIALAKTETNCLRFSELMRAVQGISQRMLSTTLRYLERDGIVTRRLYAEVPPRVEYTLTERGKGLLEPVRALFMWIDHEWPAIEKSRQEYDARNKQRVARHAGEVSGGTSRT